MTTPAAQAPPSLLGRHRLLAPSAGVHVSPLCLGAMNFGNAWKDFMGECSKDTAFEMMDYFYAHGGNFIDSANGYQNGESEQWIGDWMQARGVRDEIVLATKYTNQFMGHLARDKNIQLSNFGGNSAKSLHTSFEASLKKLKTDYVDILYVHYWDFSSNIAEVMQSLNHLVAARKVLYLGISDTPAWVVAQANAYARQHGLRPFSLYQGRWSAAERDFEREIIPMCKSEGMGLAPWGTLGGGYFKSPSSAPKEGGRTLNVRTGKEASVSQVLDNVAKRHDVPITSVALAYVLHKAPYTFPIVGGRSTSHLSGNIAALGLRLSADDMAEIETGYDFQVGFPHNFLAGANRAPEGPADIVFTKRSGHFDYVEDAKPIPAHQGSLGREGEKGVL